MIVNGKTRACLILRHRDEWRLIISHKGVKKWGEYVCLMISDAGNIVLRRGRLSLKGTLVCNTNNHLLSGDV